MADCEFKTKIQAFHDGELASEERVRVEAHLLRCRECARELESLRAISRLFGAARMPDLSEEALERLRRPHLVLDRSSLRTSEVFAAAAAMLLVACSLWLWRAETGRGGAEGALVPWESAAVTFRTESAAAGSAETRVAQEIVWDLAGEGSHD